MDLKILSWNVGTNYKGDRQSYYWSAFNKFVKYGEGACDIYCLQEVPSHEVFAAGKFVDIFSFNRGFRDHYHVIYSLGHNYSMVTLVRKNITEDFLPKVSNLALGGYPAFAQKVEIMKHVTIFNVHLLAFKKKSKCKVEKEIGSRTALRKKQIDMLCENSKDGDYFCGDFNMIRTGSHDRPGMNSIDWLQIADQDISPNPPNPLFETYHQITNSGLAPKKEKEYDYIGVRVGEGVNNPGNPYQPAPFTRKVLLPGKSGSMDTYRHHPITAEISILDR